MLRIRPRQLSLGRPNFYNFVTSSPTMPAKCDIMPDAALAAEQPKFDGFWWTRWTSEHWNIPVVACVVYLIMVFFLPKIMAAKEKMRLQPVVIVWNFGLSFFSFCGLIYCVPHLLWGEEAGLLTQGYHASVCSHASTYGFGKVGVFVYLFIYSKLAELLVKKVKEREDTLGFKLDAEDIKDVENTLRNKYCGPQGAFSGEPGGTCAESPQIAATCFKATGFAASCTKSYAQ